MYTKIHDNPRDLIGIRALDIFLTYRMCNLFVNEILTKAINIKYIIGLINL